MEQIPVPEHDNGVTAESLRNNPWTRWLHSVHKKVHEDKWNVLSCVVGLPRTGKSIFAVTMSALLNKRFDLVNDVVYTEKQFRKRVEDVKHIGETIIWDEAGVGMSARDWYRIQNREIAKMLQTIGHLRPIIWFVTPDISYIDSQPRKLFHYFFDAAHRTREYTYMRPFNIKVDKRTGKIFYRYPRLVYKGLYRTTGVKLYKPPEWFIKEYEEHSNPEKVKLRDTSNRLLDAGKVKKFDLPSLQKNIIDNPDMFMIDGKYDWNIIYLHFRDILNESGKPDIQARAIAKICQQQYDRKGAIIGK